VKTLDLLRLPRKVLQELTTGSALVEPQRIATLYQTKQDLGVHDDLDVSFEVGLPQYGHDQMSKNTRFVALHRDTLAIVDQGKRCVWIYCKETGRLTHTVASKGNDPCGIAFDAEGYMFVGDWKLAKV
jgi:hypothetical protein